MLVMVRLELVQKEKKAKSIPKTIILSDSRDNWNILVLAFIRVVEKRKCISMMSV